MFIPLNIIYKVLIFIICILAIFYNQLLNKEQKIVLLTGKTMGTFWQIKIPNLIKDKKYIKNLIQKTLDEDEDMLSSWKANSIVSQFNKLKKNQPQRINKNVFHIILTALKIHQKTYGKLDITIGTLIDMWGFGTQKKFNQYPSKKTIKKNLSLSGSQHLKIINNSYGTYLEKDINGLKINLSTLGEGFAVDHLSYMLQKEGIKNYTIAVGGTLLIKNNNITKEPKIIAVQKPIDYTTSIHLLVRLNNNSISTAGSYRNYYYLAGKRISHVIDPSNGQPITHNLVSVSVISSTGLEADSWDTALLILGFQKAKKIALKENLSVCLITKKKTFF